MRSVLTSIHVLHTTYYLKYTHCCIQCHYLLLQNCIHLSNLVYATACSLLNNTLKFSVRTCVQYSCMQYNGNSCSKHSQHNTVGIVVVLQVEKDVMRLRDTESQSTGGIVPPAVKLGADGITTLNADVILAERWPLFLTLREWLMLLDVTLHGVRFFSDADANSVLSGSASSSSSEQGTLNSIGMYIILIVNNHLCTSSQHAVTRYCCIELHCNYFISMWYCMLALPYTALCVYNSWATPLATLTLHTTLMFVTTDSYSSTNFSATASSATDSTATDSTNNSNTNTKASLRKGSAAVAAVEVSKLSQKATWPVFEKQIWPKMLINGKQSTLDASLVHTEIRSIIKGSSDSLANAGTKHITMLHYNAIL
jgi:hypothetical protein